MSDSETFVVQAQGGPAHGRDLHVRSDPADSDLPAARVEVRVDNHAEAKVLHVPYVRVKISDDTHRWIYRPAAD